jgi:hypothetical protein
MTQELSLFDTLLSTNTNTTKPQGDGQPTKEGSSLFDDLLKSVKTQTSTSAPTPESISSKSGQNSSALSEVPKTQILTTNTNNIDITKQSLPNQQIASNIVDIATNENFENKSIQTLNDSATSTSGKPVNNSQNVKVETPIQQSSIISQTINEVETNEAKTSIDGGKNTKISPDKQLIDQEVTPKSKEETKKESQPYRTTSILDNEQIKNQKPLSEIERILIDKGITIPLSKSQKLDATATDALSTNKIDVSFAKTTASSDVGVEINQNKSNINSTNIKEVGNNIENKIVATNTSSTFSPEVNIDQSPKTDTKVEVQIDSQSPTKLVESSAKTDIIKNINTNSENIIKETVSPNNKEINTSDKTIVQSNDIQVVNTKQSTSDIGAIIVPSTKGNQVEKIENGLQNISDEVKNKPKSIDNGVVSTTMPATTGGSLFDELTNIKSMPNNTQVQNKNIDTSVSSFRHQ